mmetsp:Transcript_11067/g.29030  ORF Transcript_11067/g.29030 Transcript_11067/m.29030 type:complete len:480 (+) Transcript_11067:148-1587(+)
MLSKLSFPIPVLLILSIVVAVRSDVVNSVFEGSFSEVNGSVVLFPHSSDLDTSLDGTLWYAFFDMGLNVQVGSTLVGVFTVMLENGVRETVVSSKVVHQGACTRDNGLVCLRIETDGWIAGVQSASVRTVEAGGSAINLSSTSFAQKPANASALYSAEFVCISSNTSLPDIFFASCELILLLLCIAVHVRFTRDDGGFRCMPRQTLYFVIEAGLAVNVIMSALVGSPLVVDGVFNSFDGSVTDASHITIVIILGLMLYDSLPRRSGAVRPRGATLLYRRKGVKIVAIIAIICVWCASLGVASLTWYLLASCAPPTSYAPYSAGLTLAMDAVLFVFSLLSAIEGRRLVKLLLQSRSLLPPKERRARVIKAKRIIICVLVLVGVSLVRFCFHMYLLSLYFVGMNVLGVSPLNTAGVAVGVILALVKSMEILPVIILMGGKEDDKTSKWNCCCTVSVPASTSEDEDERHYVALTDDQSITSS